MKHIAIPFEMEFIGMSRKKAREAFRYASGQKIPKDVKFKGGRYLFDLTNIEEHAPKKSFFRKTNFYYFSGDVNASLFDENKNYKSPLDIFEQNPPLFILMDKKIMVPEDSLFEEIYSEFCKQGYRDGVDKDEIKNSYLRNMVALFLAFISRGIDKGFIDRKTINYFVVDPEKIKKTETN